MLFGNSEERRFVLGYDLGEKVSQISFLASDADMPETLSVLAGSELYNIPTVLCKKNDVNQWFYGKEAVRHIEEQDGLPVYGLVSAAREGKPVAVGDGEYDPIALLTLFIKRSLSLLSMELSLDNVEAIMFTTRSLDHRMIQVLNAVTSALEFKTENIFYQSHEESFYNYMLYQPEELMNHTVVACDFDMETLRVYEMSLNHNTTPVVATIEESTYDELKFSADGFPKEGAAYHKMCERLDDEFLTVMQKVCSEKIISTVFLLGDGFREKWQKRSLEFLCRTRRVFQGNNMFSKGASIAARERINPTKPVKFVFLGEDKLKSNLGINLLKCGTEVYCALLDAGINWYEAETGMDIIMDQSGILNIQVTPLTGKMPKMVQLYLDGLEKRPPGTTRLRILMNMNSVSEVNVRVVDMGFGELFPASGKSWEQIIEL